MLKATVLQEDHNYIALPKPIHLSSDILLDSTLVMTETGIAAPLSIPAPISTDEDELTIQVTELPDPKKGELLLADSTAVKLGQILTITELQSLTFTAAEGAYGDAGTFTYAADDGWCTPAFQSIDIQLNTPIVDTTAPDLTVAAYPQMLWPNHRLVEVCVDIDVSDDFDENPTIELVSVTANQSIISKTEDPHCYDYAVTEDGHIFLRAKNGYQGQRVYTLTYSAQDSSGNTTYSTVDVTVGQACNKWGRSHRRSRRGRG